MIQLYTVKMHKIHMISRFDKHGKKIEDREEMIALTLTDLPLQTAQMYKSTDANGTCEIVKQDMTGFGQSKTRVSFDHRKDWTRSPKRTAPATAQSGSTALQQAAKTGNMAAAINAKVA